MRAGDLIQAGIVFTGERLLLTIPAFAAMNVALVACWLGVVTLLNKYLSRTPAPETVAR